MSDLIDRQMLKEDLLCGDNAEHDYCFPCKEILERIDNQPAAQQKKKNRNGRDSYGRLLVDGWHLEVSSAKINVDNDNIPIVLSVDIHGCDYHGSWFSQTLMPSAETHDKRTETHACDCVSRQAAIDAISCDITVTGRQNAELVAATIGTFADRIKALPSAQPERPSGEWTEKEVIQFDDLEAKDIITEWQSAKCDVCGKYHTTPYMYYFSDYEYCPNCGANMRGEQDG